MKSKIEKDWITAAGYRAVVLFVNKSHRCGYVRIPKSHPLYGLDYLEKSPSLIEASTGYCSTPANVFDVHGGITFSALDLLDEGDEGWWFGFDCNHVGDKTLNMPEWVEGVYRTLEYVIEECESLAHQLTERVLFSGRSS